MRLLLEESLANRAKLRSVWGVFNRRGDTFNINNVADLRGRANRDPGAAANCAARDEPAEEIPILEPTAFVLIGYVGFLLIGEEAYRVITGSPIHLPAYFKFVGILIIIWIALFYEADGAVKRIIKPFVKMAIPVMRLISRIVAIILWPIARPLGLHQ